MINARVLFQKYAFSLVLILSFFAIGLFHEWIACLAGACLLFICAARTLQGEKIVFRAGLTGAAVTILVFSYALSALWAVDSGAALIGFFKVLPFVPFLFLLSSEAEREHLIGVLPYAAAGMTVLSSVFMQIPALSSYFSVSGRLAGFFQYPNTFAMFCLVAELLLLTKKKRGWLDYVFIAVLAFGILYSGSRTVLLLAVAASFAAVITGMNKKARITALVLCAAGVFVLVMIALFSKEDSVFHRLLTISWKESTFVGRLLYFRDALPVILKNPFGLGYMGYYFTQQSFQTGLYSVRFIHNDFLQILLDVGWIPCGLMIAAIGKTLFNRKILLGRRIILFAIFLHALFDFDLQFPAMFFVLLLFLDDSSGGERVLNKKKTVFTAVSVLTACVSLYLGTALALSHFGKAEASQAMYPWNTQNEILLLTKQTDTDEMERMANDILRRNDSVSVAYSAKARVAYSRGDFGEVIRLKKIIFEKAPFGYDDYEEYCRMLINGVMLYTQSGDTKSAEFCREELFSTRTLLKKQEERVSALGKMIRDQPQTELPEDILDYMKRAEERVS